MKPLHGNRSDFVLGMSLAEIMILLIFSMFLFVTADASNIDIEKKMREEQNEKLRVALQLKNDEMKKLANELQVKNELIAELSRMSGVEVKETGDLKKAAISLTRGRPMCHDPNVLLDVVAVDGQVEVTLLDPEPELLAFLSKSNMRIEPGYRFRGDGQLEKFLSSVWQYEKARNCRYDYRLTYKTAEDYLSRERFERYFYPGGGVSKWTAKS